MEPRTAIDVLIGFSRLVSEGDVPPDTILERLADAVVGQADVGGLVVVQTGAGGWPQVALARHIVVDLAGAEDLGEDLERVVVASTGASPDAVVTLPLIASGGLFGAVVLVWDGAPHALGVQLAEGLVDLAAVALDRAERTRSLQETLIELEQSREALARKEKLEALGKMAAVVAHEVKNPLASVSGALQVLAGRMDGGSTEARIIDRLLERVTDLGGMLDDLLEFARPRLPVPTRIRLHDLCRGSLDDLEADPRFAEVDVQVRVSPGDGTVLADASQLRALLLNLLLNAAQAMAGAGTIHLTAEVAHGQVRIAVQDQGPGVADAVADTIFEPFITTKSRGSGLGLATARQVAESHGGALEHVSPDEGGARFVLTLPA